MANIAYCISPAVFAKIKDLRLLSNEVSESIDFLSLLPVSLKEVGKEVLDLLLTKGNLQVQNDCTIGFNGHVVPNSDIRELLLKLITQDPALYGQVGATEFIEAVKSALPTNKYQLPEEQQFDSSHWIRFEDNFNFS